MKNFLFLLPIALLGFACKKDDPGSKKKPDVPAVVKYYPTQVVRTSTATTDITTTRYSYNAAQQLIKEEILINEVLQHAFTYSYTANGSLLKKTRFNDQNIATEQDAFERDAAGRITRLNHAYLDISGNATPHHYNSFSYNGNGQLLERGEFTPNDQFLKKLVFELVRDSVEKVRSYRNNNSLELTSQAHYDLKKHPLSATGLNQNNLPGNVTLYTLTDASNQDTTTITSAISYNEAGYPLKIVQTYSDGRIITDTYTYRSN